MHLVILGGGTAGTIMCNRLMRELDSNEWAIKVIEPSTVHYYQPGFLFIPFGIYSREDVIRPSREFYPSGVEVIGAPAERIEADQNRVVMSDGQSVPYDLLIIATGSRICPDEIEGMTGDGWQRNIFDFYTIDGACKLADFLADWSGGRMVVNVAEMPIKCPVAPLEFLFLADWWFRERGMRDKVEIEYVTPLAGAFTKPIAAKYLGQFLERKEIQLTTEFSIGRVEPERNRIVSWDEREVTYDLLVPIPTNMGAEIIGRSGLGNDLRFVPTDPGTLRSKAHENIFVLGDATDLPSSKAGSVAHFESEILVKNVLSVTRGQVPKETFDGHANCFIESGYGKGVLIDFNNEVEPLPGKFPYPVIGPFSLLEETRMNHWGKMGFRWVYWQLLLRGRDLPIETRMSMAGKRRPAE